MHATTQPRRTVLTGGRIPSRRRQREVLAWWNHTLGQIAVPFEAPDMMDGEPYFCEGNAEFQCDHQITRGRLCSECRSDSR